jgi:AcrR family transcriptional regulator
VITSVEGDDHPRGATDLASACADAFDPARPEAPQATSHDRIVEAAERLIRQIGHQKTAVVVAAVDIARAMSTSPANVHRFFASKDAINEAICRRIFDDQVSAATAVASRRSRADDRLRALLLELGRLNGERSRNNKALQKLLAVTTTENWSVAADYADRIESILADIVVDGIKEGVFTKVDPRRAGRFAHAAMLRYLHPALVVEYQTERRPTLVEMVDFCLAALQKPRPVPARPCPDACADERPNNPGAS